jgi:hypothetical protein
MAEAAGGPVDRQGCEQLGQAQGLSHEEFRDPLSVSQGRAIMPLAL